MIPVVAAIIFNTEKQVLIARRKSTLSNGGKWEFPGGKLHPGEEPEKCIQREIQEELGIRIVAENIFYAVNKIYPTFNLLLLAYHCRYVSGQVQLKDHDEICWVPVSRLLEYDLSEADIEVAKKLMKTN
ncbi:MAG: 8-oxo-dGTP diphosphatase MutT [Calditrichaeota bacterium]|nr:MAG: 8-oxo-dGTP diphosphatase MutT [Calditrichota bacterium]